MPLPPWTHRAIAQLAVNGTLNGQRVVNVFAFEHKIPDLASDDLRFAWSQELMDAWISACQPAYLACLSASYNLDRLTCQVVQPNRLVPAEHAYSVATPGTVASSSAPPSVAAVIKWRSNLAGKSHRGRSYLPGVPAVGWYTNGVIDVANRAVYQTFITDMLDAFGPLGTEGLSDFTIYSRPDPDPQWVKRVGGNLVVEHGPADYGGNSTHVISGALDPNLRQQRRREVGVGA